MLSEYFIAATIPSQKPAPSANLKDAGIFTHEFQPLAALRSTFKKSSTPQNCLATSASHIFAAQTEKAVIHVYSREKGNQEAIVPFQERIHSLALAANDTILVLGTESGRVILWESCSGRQVQTSQTHLQPVTALAVDPGSNFLLSGSADSNINVWSLLDLLSFSAPPTTDFIQRNVRLPLHTLPNHRSGITSIVTGQSTSLVNIAVSASKDKKCIVWNYKTGDALRTYLLPSTPLCLALDPADRAFYTAYEDGSIQLVDFFADNKSPTNCLYDPSLADTPVQLPSKSRWTAASQNLEACLSLSVSYDGTTLLSGHQSGKVVSWDVARGMFTSVLADLNGAVTNLHFLPPMGFPNITDPKLKIQTVRKPRLDASVGQGQGSGVVPGDYTFTAQFSSQLHLPSFSATERQMEPYSSEFEVALTHPSFPASLLENSLAELASWNQASQHPSSVAHLASDFMALDGSSDEPEDPATVMGKENAELKARVEHMQRLQKASFAQLTALTEEKPDWLEKEEEERQKRLRRKRKERKEEERKWNALGVRGNGRVTPEEMENGEGSSAEDDDEEDDGAEEHAAGEAGSSGGEESDGG